MQCCAGIAEVVLPAVGLDCSKVQQAVQRVEAAAAGPSAANARLSLLHLAVRSGCPALVRPCNTPVIQPKIIPFSLLWIW